jgi:hypothetical protein
MGKSEEHRYFDKDLIASVIESILIESSDKITITRTE